MSLDASFCALFQSCVLHTLTTGAYGIYTQTSQFVLLLLKLCKRSPCILFSYTWSIFVNIVQENQSIPLLCVFAT